MKIEAKTILFIFLSLMVSFSYQFEDFGIFSSIRHKKENKSVSNSTIVGFSNSTNSTNPDDLSSIAHYELGKKLLF